MKRQSPRALTRPRHYAALIFQAAGDVALQCQIFEACPVEMRAQVRDLTQLGLYQAEKLLAHKRLVQCHAERKSAPLPSRRCVSPLKSTPEIGQKHLAELRASHTQKDSV